MERPERRANRLKTYDYSAPGAYFVTFCTKGRRCVLSEIVVGAGLAPPSVVLSPIGQIVEEQILPLPDRFPSLSVDRYVIMPNHVHLLLTIHSTRAEQNMREGQAPPLHNNNNNNSVNSITGTDIRDVMRVLKSQTSRLSGAAPLWQRSYYDHVVRHEAEYNEIAEYIGSNPAR